MSHWWRAHDEAVDDPKLIMLSDKQHRGWFNLMCLASAHGGILPDIKVVAVKLRMTPAKAEMLLHDLMEAGLVDKTEAGLKPHNWAERQYQSDQPAQRSGDGNNYVYIVGTTWDAVAVKIGFSKNPWARVVEFQTGSPDKLSVLAAFRTGETSEIDIHTALKEFRQHGEWFALPDSVKTIFRSAPKGTKYVDIVALLRGGELRSNGATTTDTDSEKKDAASAAPPNLERQLFERGKQVAGKEAGGLIAKLLKAKKGDVALARAAIEMAATKHNPREYIGAVIAGGHASADGKRLTNDEQFWGIGRIPGIT